MVFRKTILKVVENPTYVNFYKLVIQMSDGIIIGSKNINPEILEFAKKTGKPLLPYQTADTYVDAYSAFYDQMLQSKT